MATARSYDDPCSLICAFVYRTVPANNYQLRQDCVVDDELRCCANILRIIQMGGDDLIATVTNIVGFVADLEDFVIWNGSNFLRLLGISEQLDRVSASDSSAATRKRLQQHC